MSNSYDPPKKALLIAIQHVRGKPGSRFDDLPDLVFAHRDAMLLRNTLISSHGYHPDDIVLMKDDKNHPEPLWPTRKRILAQMQLLTESAPENCHVTFYFSGHCLEEECLEHARKRADGRDSEIVCADGKSIFDHELHKYLVEPLEHVKGSKLFTLSDCCHSENLLDLQNGQNPNTYSRAWNISRGQLFKDIAWAIVNLLRLNKKYVKCHRTPQSVRRLSTKLVSSSTSNALHTRELSVICLFACRDQQLAHDDCKLEDTFTKFFIETLSKADITWEGLRDELKKRISAIRVRYEEASMALLADPKNYEHWAQDPGLITSPHMNLGQAILL